MNESAEQKPRLAVQWIDPEALRIVDKLQSAGHTTYLVGGCVRDLLLGIYPKDFDISTTAHPQQVKRLVPYSYIIGRRFRLVLVKRGDQQFEVSTFRKLNIPGEDDQEVPADTGPIMDDNEFGTPEDDALRRDFTVNGLFYDPSSGDLIDYVGGLEDIKSGHIKMIGDPYRRLEEDPIRILRALRMAHKVKFTLESELRKAMSEKANTLGLTVLPRRREETLKWLRLPKPSLVFLEAYDLGVLEYLLPSLNQQFFSSKFMDLFLFHLDQMAEYHSHQSTPKELFTSLLFAYELAYQEVESQGPHQDILLDPLLGQMMRNELGMFKYEQHDIAQAFQMLKMFPKLQDFKKRSRHRQQSFFMKESFPLALSMARIDYLIEPKALAEWKQMYEDFLPDLKDLTSPKKPRRSSRRRTRSTVKN